ncbi:cerebellin-4-like [Eriocheir sinensis]|uniref:cerebellin-4-like n=1 Tax=Eriocheir sinensis TaxID=95602 RepID=UPI0021C8818A|nr:cerebellin-4-like [Eriocheir sinensis]
MWKYGVVVLLLASCTGRPQVEPEECYGIYCDDADNSTQTYYYDGEDGDAGDGPGNETNPLARELLFYRTRPSYRVVYRRANFCGVRAQASGLKAPSRLHFQNVHVNTGKPWRDNGSFVAPHEGGYFFAFHGTSARNSNFTVALMLNNYPLVWAYSRRGRYMHSSTSLFYFLLKGDVIKLQLEEGAIYENPYVNAYNSFSSFMMFRNDLK